MRAITKRGWMGSGIVGRRNTTPLLLPTSGGKAESPLREQIQHRAGLLPSDAENLDARGDQHLLAGEVDRGTIDVLLGLPVSRTQLYLCVTVVSLGAGLCVLLSGLAGNLIAGWFVGPEVRTAPGRLATIVANLYCLYIAVAGAALLISSVSDHRGRAVGITFAFILASFFLSFLAQFWAPAKAMALVSVLTYYRPLLIVENSGWPIGNMVVLVSVGAAFWLAGAIVFARRDICTV